MNLFTVAAQLICVAPDGKVLWDRSLPDEYGAVTTHGGRTTSPIVEGDKVIFEMLRRPEGNMLGEGVISDADEQQATADYRN